MVKPAWTDVAIVAAPPGRGTPIAVLFAVPDTEIQAVGEERILHETRVRHVHLQSTIVTAGHSDASLKIREAG
jgi:hypothetical protein